MYELALKANETGDDQHVKPEICNFAMDEQKKITFRNNYNIIEFI